STVHECTCTCPMHELSRTHTHTHTHTRRRRARKQEREKRRTDEVTGRKRRPGGYTGTAQTHRKSKQITPFEQLKSRGWRGETERERKREGEKERGDCWKGDIPALSTTEKDGMY